MTSASLWPLSFSPVIGSLQPARDPALRSSVCFAVIGIQQKLFKECTLSYTCRDCLCSSPCVLVIALRPSHASGHLTGTTGVPIRWMKRLRPRKLHDGQGHWASKRQKLGSGCAFSLDRSYLGLNGQGAPTTEEDGRAAGHRPAGGGGWSTAGPRAQPTLGTLRSVSVNGTSSVCGDTSRPSSSQPLQSPVLGRMWKA